MSAASSAVARTENPNMCRTLRGERGNKSLTYREFQRLSTQRCVAQRCSLFANICRPPPALPPLIPPSAFPWDDDDANTWTDNT